jgi:hypothetical protein
MLRKNHVKTHATPDSTGLADSRMTASTTPPTTPTTIEQIVTRIVPLSRPSITGRWFMALATNDHSKAWLATSRCSSIRLRTAMTAIATHRP